jgi:glycerol-3-phosphate dehydrogenase
MHAFDALTLDRNRGIKDPQRRVGNAQFLSRTETRQLFPLIDPVGLTGAAVFEDGQMHNPARLVLAMIESAVDAGAVVANYVEAVDFVFAGDTVRGVEVVDRVSGASFAIEADLVLNAAGPWAEYLLRDRARFAPQWQRGPFSRDAYFIVNRCPTSKYGLAVAGLSRDEDAVLGRATRHLFLAPWRDRTLVGVWHRLFPQHPDTARIEIEELQQWLGELNAVNPELNLKLDEVSFGNCGLVPFGEHADAQSLQFGKESRFVDHRKTHGVGGLVTLIGIRYTMARADAERALDMLLAQRERQPPQVDTSQLPLAGGAIDNVAALHAHVHSLHGRIVGAASLDSLLRHQGANYARVLRHIEADPRLRDKAPGTDVLAAEIHHAVTSEMALHLDDVVFRRTDMSGHAHPGDAALAFAAERMGALLGWTAQRVADEITATRRTLMDHHARELRSSAMATSPPIGSTLAAVNA